MMNLIMFESVYSNIAKKLNELTNISYKLKIFFLKVWRTMEWIRSKLKEKKSLSLDVVQSDYLQLQLLRQKVRKLDIIIRVGQLYVKRSILNPVIIQNNFKVLPRSLLQM